MDYTYNVCITHTHTGCSAIDFHSLAYRKNYYVLHFLTNRILSSYACNLMKHREGLCANVNSHTIKLNFETTFSQNRGGINCETVCKKRAIRKCGSRIQYVIQLEWLSIHEYVLSLTGSKV